MISEKSMHKDLIIENMLSHDTAHLETLWVNSIQVLKLSPVLTPVHLLTTLLLEITAENNKNKNKRFLQIGSLVIEKFVRFLYCLKSPLISIFLKTNFLLLDSQPRLSGETNRLENKTIGFETFSVWRCRANMIYKPRCSLEN